MLGLACAGITVRKVSHVRNLKEDLCLGADRSLQQSLHAAQPAIQPTADITKVPAAAQPSPQFDAEAATEAYMAMIPPAAMARSNAYFEGGYWLILWDFLYASAISLLLLNLRWSARMRDLAERITRFRWLQTLFSTGCNTSSSRLCSAFRSSSTRTTCASTNTAWPRRPSGRGWATNSRRCWSSLDHRLHRNGGSVRHRAQVSSRHGGFGARSHPWAC